MSHGLPIFCTSRSLNTSAVAMALPDLREALVNLEQGKPREAVRMLEQVTAQLPAYAAAHAVLARAYEEAGRPAAARRTWQAARFMVPNSPVVREGVQRAGVLHPAGRELALPAGPVAHPALRPGIVARAVPKARAAHGSGCA